MILAFDPGVTTGWAYYSPMFDKYGFGQLDDDLPNIYKFLDKTQPKVIAYENFTHRPGIMKSELYSIEVIGVIRLWSQQHYVPNFKYLPAEAKAFWKDSKLKKLDLWGPGQGHAMDAMRVLLTYRIKTDERWKQEVFGNLHE